MAIYHNIKWWLNHWEQLTRKPGILCSKVAAGSLLRRLGGRMAEALEGFWLKGSAGITSKIGPLTHKQLLGSSLEHSKFVFTWPILLLAYWKWLTTSIRQGASQTTNNNPSEKFLNQPGLSSGYLRTNLLQKVFYLGVYRLMSLGVVVYPSFLLISVKHGTLVSTYTSLGIGRFLCSVTHQRKLKKNRWLDINILEKWELQTVQHLSVRRVF